MLLPYPVIQLKKGKERSLLQKHPWVFSGAIANEPASLLNGDLVQVISSKGDYLATGHFQRGTISIRCIDFEQNILDDVFFKNKIKKCVSIRNVLSFPNKETTAFRLIHGEGDGMPGLIADVYGNTVVLQSYTLGMQALKPRLAQLLLEELPYVDAVYDKSVETMSKHGHDTAPNAFLAKSENYIPHEVVLEHGIHLNIDFINGQKTGFFLDQRDNRQLLKQYSEGKKVLNTFSYTGGFSVAALEGGASEVHSVDSSARAIEGLELNIAANSFKGQHHSYISDVMTFLRPLEKPYDIVVLDPPAFAKHLNQVSNAMIGYRNLNTEGLKHVKPGGLLFTFSCSQAVDKELFRKVIFQSAMQANREVKILHQLTQPGDHPVSIYHPEAEYLKGLVLYVE